MKVIHKYKLDKTVNHITLPEDSDLYDILHIGVQDNEIFVWILLDEDWVEDPEHESKIFALVVVGTGEPFEDDDEYGSGMYHRGTVIVPPFVWHIFESDQDRHQPEQDED